MTREDSQPGGPGKSGRALPIGLVPSVSVALTGGQPTLSRYLVKGFRELGRDVVLFNPGPPVDDFPGATVQNVNQRGGVGSRFYWLERFRSPIRRAAASTGPFSPWLTTLYLQQSASRMAKLISTGPACSSYLAIGDTAPLACLMAEVPYATLCVAMSHRTYDHVFQSRKSPGLVRRHFVQRIAEMELTGIQGARAWLANSLDLQSYLQEFAGAEPVDLLWSPPGMDGRGKELSVAQARANLGIPGEALVVATVGRMDATKAVDTLIRALAGLQRAQPKLQLILAGDGVMESHYQRMAADLGVNARFFGLRNDVENFYRAADVVVLLFHTLGGTSSALLEAMTCGAAVVTNRIYGREAIPFEDQVSYADVDSPESVREAISSILGSRELRLGLGERAQGYVERNHGWTPFVATLERLVRSMSVN